jgi:hypothetical protein
MAHQLQTPEGKKLYALRKQVPEPVLGIIKSVLGFRQFLLRGIDRVRGEEPCDHGLECETAVRPPPRLRRGERRGQPIPRRLNRLAVSVAA